MARTYNFISADAHIEVPCEHWTPRVEKKYRDIAPRRVRLPNVAMVFWWKGVPSIVEA